MYNVKSYAGGAVCILNCFMMLSQPCFPTFILLSLHLVTLVMFFYVTFSAAGACLSWTLSSQMASFLSWCQFCPWYMENWLRYYNYSIGWRITDPGIRWTTVSTL